MYKKNNEQRGVTLLIVLAMMVMFAMLTTAFMVIVTHNRRTAEVYAKIRIEQPAGAFGSSLIGGGVRHSEVLEEAFQILLTGGLDNIVGPHSVLENLYGHPRQSNYQQHFNVVGIQEGLLVLQFPPESLLNNNILGNVVTLQFSEDYLQQNPNAARLHNKSTFIVDIRWDNMQPRVRLAPFTVSDMPVQLQNAVLSTAGSGNRWLILNAPQFSGTGAGYDGATTTSALLSLIDNEGKPFALRPNHLAPRNDANLEYRNYLQNNDVRMNPDYTAPDFMTMFLAWNDVQDDGKTERIIPSFHRPQLVRYWQEIDSTNNRPNVNPTELRKYVLRPLPADHPQFTGSNPAAAWNTNLDETVRMQRLVHFLINGPWDVDSDGNGIADSIWLDIGLRARFDARTQSWYKPLVAFYVIDMDGRINVNTLSNLAHFGTPDPSLSTGDIKGTGMGSAELTSPLVKVELLTGGSGYTGRYGSDRIPGAPGGGIANELLYRHGINLDAYTQGGLLADWFGYAPIKFDSLGNRVVSVPDAPYDNPYRINPYSGSSGDEPFNTAELESLLRSVIDTDYGGLDKRLRILLGDGFDPATFASPELRYNLGTRSSDIPVALPLYNRIRALTADDDEALKLWMLLPVEIRRGEKVNLNRLTLRSDWMTGGDELLKAKARFAQEIFYLLQVVLYDDMPRTEATLERLAQWSVNLVDFIDPDDVMTPFVYKTEIIPDRVHVMEESLFNNLIDRIIAGTLTAPELDGCSLIWGFEKPEVAITETLALHNRGVASLPDSTTDFRQVLYPQGSLFVELQRLGNPHRSYQASSLVDSGNTLNLAKKTHGSGELIWRIAIGEAAKPGQGRFTWNNDDHPEKNALRQLLAPNSGNVFYPQFYQQANGTPNDGHYHPDLGAPERFIWFGSESDSGYLSADLGILRRSYFRSEGAAPVLETDTTFVIAPRWETNFALGESINLPVERTMIATGPTAPIELNPARTRAAEVNASEPLPTIDGSNLRDGYFRPNHPSYPVAADAALPRFDLPQRGTIPCYKTICLQRLADPTRPHHAICNPYITVDWSMIDLQVFNSVSKSELNIGSNQLTEELDGTMPKDSDMHFSSRRWEQTTSGVSNLWDRTLAATDLTGKAGLEQTGYATDDDGLAETAPSHSLGESNFAEPFLHFPWYDAPLMNTGELMLIPSTAPGRFSVEFHDNGTSESFFGDEPRYSYRYNNFTFPLYLDWGGDTGKVHLFDFVRVPSRFAGTIQDTSGWWPPPGPGVSPNPYDPRRPIYSMREPGKVNVNTITRAAWESLQNDRSGFPSYNDFRRSRQWSGDPDDYPSEFRPFRSPSAVQNVPPLNTNVYALVDTPLGATLLDLDLIVDTAANPYMALENAMRLSDVTTTRSNVFAVWITVGYFEVEKFDDLNDLRTRGRTLYDESFSHIANPAMFNAVYPGGFVLGAEKGLDDGTVRRHRAFYLIDRSIPVGFRRGEELNSKDVVIKKTLLE